MSDSQPKIACKVNYIGAYLHLVEQLKQSLDEVGQEQLAREISVPREELWETLESSMKFSDSHQPQSKAFYDAIQKLEIPNRENIDHKIALLTKGCWAFMKN